MTSSDKTVVVMFVCMAVSSVLIFLIAAMFDYHP